MTLQEILESVKSGSVSVEEAERILKKESYEEMGYAKLDTSRKARTGFAEVIYCSNKADEHLLNIFERFYRVDKSHSKEIGGTGLGLSIVKHAVSTLNGSIVLRSEEGSGTEITMKFLKVHKE